MLQLANIQARALVKVIGPMSPNATWVKEKDEFESGDIYTDGLGFIWWFDYKGEKSSEPNGYYKYLRVKGPCGHFH